MSTIFRMIFPSLQPSRGKPSVDKLLEDPSIGEKYKRVLADYNMVVEARKETSRRRMLEFWADLRDELGPNRDFSNANWTRIVDYVNTEIDPFL